MVRSPQRYLTPDDRDFFARLFPLTHRSSVRRSLTGRLLLARAAVGRALGAARYWAPRVLGAGPRDATAAGAGSTEPTYLRRRARDDVRGPQSRLIGRPGHAGAREPRTLVTVVRYPTRRRPGRSAWSCSATGSPSRRPTTSGCCGRGRKRDSSSPRRSSRWGTSTRRAAPNENDIVNQPRDMSFVISQLLAASARPGGPLSGLIDPGEIAVAGQSDGGSTALAAAYDSAFRRSPRTSRGRYCRAPSSGSAATSNGRARHCSPSRERPTR